MLQAVMTALDSTNHFPPRFMHLCCVSASVGSRDSFLLAFRRSWIAVPQEVVLSPLWTSWLSGLSTSLWHSKTKPSLWLVGTLSDRKAIMNRSWKQTLWTSALHCCMETFRALNSWQLLRRSPQNIHKPSQYNTQFLFQKSKTIIHWFGRSFFVNSYSCDFLRYDVLCIIIGIV